MSKYVTHVRNFLKAIKNIANLLNVTELRYFQTKSKLLKSPYFFRDVTQNIWMYLPFFGGKLGVESSLTLDARCCVSAHDSVSIKAVFSEKNRARISKRCCNKFCDLKQVLR